MRVLAGAVVGLALLAACTSSAPRVSSASSVDAGLDTGVSAQDEASWDAVADALPTEFGDAADVDSTSGPDASQAPCAQDAAPSESPPCSLTAPSPPSIACNADSGPDAAVCSAPRSVCGNSTWLFYYDNGQCVSGMCTWKTKSVYCGMGCIGGSCNSLGTPQAPN